MPVPHVEQDMTTTEASKHLPDLVEADLAAGHVRRFDDDEEFLAYLEILDDQAGG